MKKNHLFLLFCLFAIAISSAQACFKEIRGGKTFTIGLKEDNTLWGWGSNSFHQLGDGTTTSRQSSQQIGTATWSKFTVGDYHVLAIKSDGTLWGWGRNENSQLTGSPAGDIIVPTQIGTDNNWAQITTGRMHSTGIKTDGTLWTWGYNDSGVLGDGTLITKITPVQLGTANDWVKVYSGYYHTLAIKSNGTLWTWGVNLGGLGDGGTNDLLVPTQIGTDTNWAAISAGNGHSVAIKSNGTMWSCGSNAWGQLGLGLPTSTSPAVYFTQIGTDTNWQLVAAGLGHNLAVKTDGTLWSWGLNNCGQIGNGTIDTTVQNYVLSPYQIGTNTDWSKVAVGSHNSFALKADNMLWSWGYDIQGVLGDHDTASKGSPIAISCTALETILAVDQAAPLSVAVKVYPNPTTSLLNIAVNNFQAGQITVYDIQGRLVLTEKMSGTEHQLNISHLENGTYFLTVTSVNNSATVKLIKN